MGTAFNKGKRTKNSAENNNNGIHKSHGSKHSSSFINGIGIKTKNVNNSDNKNGNINLVNASQQNQENTGSSSGSSVNHQQQHPYLNTLNVNINEINTGLTSSLIPSNSKSTSSYNKANGTPQPQLRPIRNNTTDKHLNTLNMHKLLTFGWIREHCIKLIQQTEDDNDNDNIPEIILEKCFEFMYIERILFCFIASESEKISTLQAIDVNNIYKTQFTLSKDINIGYDTNGICIYSENNMIFPSNITQKYELDYIKNRYHCIFKCGSQINRESKCLIIPQAQFEYSTNKQSYNASKTNIDDNGIICNIFLSYTLYILLLRKNALILK